MVYAMHVPQMLSPFAIKTNEGYSMHEHSCRQLSCLGYGTVLLITEVCVLLS